MKTEDTNVEGLPAQGPDAGDTTQVAEQPVNGIQRRIDELVAKSYEKDATINQLQQSVTELVGKLTQQVTAPQQAPAPSNPFEGMDYSDPESVQAAFTRAMGAMEQRFQQQLGQVAGRAAQNEVGSIAAAWGVQNPAIVQRAQALVAAWKQRGYDFVPEDAVTFAVGEAQRAGGSQPRDPRGQYAPMNPVMGGAGPAAPASRPPPRSQALPQNFDDLSPDDQLRILESRGAGDAIL